MEYLGDADEAGPEAVRPDEDAEAGEHAPFPAAEASSLAGAGLALTSLLGGSLVQLLFYVDVGGGEPGFDNPARAIVVGHGVLAGAAAVLAGIALGLHRPESARWSRALAAASLGIVAFVGLFLVVGWYIAEPPSLQPNP